MHIPAYPWHDPLGSRDRQACVSPFTEFSGFKASTSSPSCKYKKRTCTYLGTKSAVREKKDGERGQKEREGDRSVNYYPATNAARIREEMQNLASQSSAIELYVRSIIILMLECWTKLITSIKLRNNNNLFSRQFPSKWESNKNYVNINNKPELMIVTKLMNNKNRIKRKKMK